MSRKAKRGSGGLLCYIRSELSEGISPIDHLSPQEDRIWLRLNAAFFGFSRDVLICFAYVTPESSCHQSSRNNLWITLQEEIALLSHEGDLILTGDYNARTGEEQDFIPNDSESYIPLPPDYQVDHCPSRFSQDKKCNNYGKELLSICQSARLRMLNGRIGNDHKLGQFTCFTSQGSSVVDYTIVSEELLEKIDNFTVGALGSISDHCPLIMALKSESYSMLDLHKLNIETGELLEDFASRLSQPTEAETADPALSCKWSPKLEEQIRVKFSTESFHAQTRKVMESLPLVSAEETASSFASLLQESVRSLSPGTSHHRSKTSNFPCNTWFDEECKERRRVVKSLGKTAKLSPDDNLAREKFIREKATYKSLLKRKKRSRASILHHKLPNLKTKNPSLFWKWINTKNKAAEPSPIATELIPSKTTSDP